MRSDRAAGNWWAVQQHTEGTEQRPLAFSTLSLTLSPSLPSLTPSCSLMLTHFVSHSMPTSLSPLSSLYLCLACLCLPPASTTFLPSIKTSSHCFLYAFFFLLQCFLPSPTQPSSSTPLFFSSHLPLSLPSSLCESTEQSCEVLFTKHKAFRISMLHLGSLATPLYVCACMGERQWERDKKKSHNRAECCFIH